MYITNTTNNVIELFNLLETRDDIAKTKFLIYIFKLLNENKIKENETIFNLDKIGYSSNISNSFMYYLVAIYNIYDKENKIKIENNDIININLNEEKDLIFKFDKLDFIEKIDVINELIMRYHHIKYFNQDLGMIKFSDILSSKDISNMISKFKKRIK